jgi:ATP-dependent helicase/nuclease subunit A
LFARVLDTPGGLKILTIHAFCQSLLARFPLEAGVAPHFSVMDERDAEAMRAEALLAVLLRAGDDPALAAALTEATRHVDARQLKDLLWELVRRRQNLTEAVAGHGSLAAATAALAAGLGVGTGQEADDVIAAACADDAFDGQGLRAAAAALTGGMVTDQKRAALLLPWLAASPLDRIATFDSYLGAFLTKEKEKDKDNKGMLRPIRSLVTKEVARSHPGIAECLGSEAERLERVIEQQRGALTAAASVAVMTLAAALVETYERHKARHALLDYDDLIAATVRLLEADQGSSWVLYKLDGGIDHVLIDEAQDTSPEQWRVITALTSEFFAGDGVRSHDRSVFAVGDIKQSIFSFQGADPQMFLAHRARFGEQVTSARGRWREIDLSVSFRSTRAVLAAVDAVFARPAAASGVRLDAAPIVHQAHRARQGGRVEVWPPVQPRDSDAAHDWKPPVESRTHEDQPQLRLARLITRRIRAWLDRGEILESQGRPVRAGDIMVLVRRRTAFVEDLVRELKAARVPVAGIDRMMLPEQVPVMDLIALGRFTLLPGDDLTLATVLKGPLIGFDEEALFTLAWHRADGQSLWQALRERAAAGAEPFASAQRRLGEILRFADQMPPFEFFARILGPLGGRRRFIERLGREAEDPIAEFLQLALSYERTRVPSLQDFLHWIEAGAVELKRDAEQDARDMVRIMTVHGAKGLQAPIVFLPDTLQVPQQTPRVMWCRLPGAAAPLPVVQPRADYRIPLLEGERNRLALAQEQEYRRLLYVAMTRACDRLIICGWETKKTTPAGCWYTLITTGLDEAAAALGLQQIEDAELAAAPELDHGRIRCLVCPQLDRPEERPAPPARTVPPLPAWALVPPGDEPASLRPLAPAQTYERRRMPASPGGGGAGGAAIIRGKLIHALLQRLPEIVATERRARAARWLARRAPELAPPEQADIIDEVLAVLDDPLFAPAFAPSSQAEVPIAGSIAGRLITGRLDRLAVDGHSVLVIDYKSDRTPPPAEDAVPSAYLRQMAAYRGLLSQAFPGHAIHCALLWTGAPLLMTLRPATLDRFSP